MFADNVNSLLLFFIFAVLAPPFVVLVDEFNRKVYPEKKSFLNRCSKPFSEYSDTVFAVMGPLENRLLKCSNLFITNLGQMIKPILDGKMLHEIDAFISHSFHLCIINYLDAYSEWSVKDVSRLFDNMKGNRLSFYKFYNTDPESSIQCRYEIHVFVSESW